MNDPITGEENISRLIDVSSIRLWRMSVDAHGQREDNQLLQQQKMGWVSMCVCGFNEREYKNIMEMAKSFGEDIHLGRRDDISDDWNPTMGGYTEPSCWFQFRNVNDYHEFATFIRTFPARDRVMKIQNMHVEAKTLLTDASTLVIEAERGTFMFYCSGGVSKDDEVIIALVCGKMSIIPNQYQV